MFMIDFNRPFLDLNGQVINDEKGQPLQLNKVLANMLVISQNKKFEAIKKLEMGRKLYNDGKLELDKSDMEAVRAIVDESGTTAIVAGQIIEILNDSK